MKQLDARNLACPAPVLMAKDMIEKEQPDAFVIVVNNEGSKQNVCRFLSSAKYSAQTQAKGEDFYITAAREGAAVVQTEQDQAAPDEKLKIMVVLSTDRFGYGDDVLGKALVVNFIKTLKEMGEDLWRLVLVNNGVKLTLENSPVLADLQELVASGVDVFACGTCLDHFKLMDQKKVGVTTNMLDIVTGMQLADKVVSLG